ncbi:MAG: PepSY domain-containing protein [Acetobacteraceae bacterium]
MSRLPRLPRLAMPLVLGIAAALPLSAAMASPDAPHQDRPSAERHDDGARSLASARIDAAGAISAVRSAGYDAVRDVEWEHGTWEVKARSAEGRTVKLRVDATTGAVTHHRH